MLRVTAVVVFLALTGHHEAVAGATRHMSCSVVRFYVAKYSAAAAESWARSRGATDAEIETARRCLGSSGVQSATYAQRGQPG